MRIKDIYFRKGNCAVTLLISVFCVAATTVSVILPDTYPMIAYAFPVKYIWQTCTGVFLHGSPDLPIAVTAGHLLFNLLLVLPFGLMIEKILGSRKFTFITLGLWIVNAVTFYVIAFAVTPPGETAYGAGISGIAFSYGVIGAYCLFCLGKNSFQRLLKQVSFYLLLNILLVMAIMVNPYVAGLSTMIIHIVAIAAGAVCVAFERTALNEFFNAKDAI